MHEFARLASLGWAVVDPSADGVRYISREVRQVSYPRDVLDSFADEGGSGFWLEARARSVGELCNEAGLSLLWEVGAGSGSMAKRLVGQGVDVVSIEPLPEGARTIAQMGFEVFCGKLEDLNLPSASAFLPSACLT